MIDGKVRRRHDQAGKREASLGVVLPRVRKGRQAQRHEDLYGTRLQAIRGKACQGLVWILILLFVLPASASAEVPQLKKPDWTDCSVGGEKFACLSVDQLKHYLELYLRYKSGLKKITMLEERVGFHEKWELKWDQNLGKLMVQVGASNVLIREFRDAPPPDTGVPVWEVVAYVIVSVITGIGIGAAGVALAK